jgi:hypothetical protein
MVSRDLVAEWPRGGCASPHTFSSILRLGFHPLSHLWGAAMTSYKLRFADRNEAPRPWPWVRVISWAFLIVAMVIWGVLIIT